MQRKALYQSGRESFSIIILTRVLSNKASGAIPGLIHSSIKIEGSMRGILLCISETSVPGSLVSTTKVGKFSSI